MKNKSIILLSGGLDSLASLAVAKDDYNISLALTFDYGQRAKDREINSSREIAKFYNIEHKVIELPWLKQITNTSLVNRDENLPELKINELDSMNLIEDSAKRVWVPNRNGLFVNIAASYADSFGFTHIIFGANKEEATTFPDNSEEFVSRINKSLEYSTLAKPKLYGPLAGFDKKEIVKIAIEKKIPFNLLRSCYTDNIHHCAECESCLRLKRAIVEAGDEQILEMILEKNKMRSKFIEQEIIYSGKELCPHWIYRNFNIVGDAIVAFIGEAEVKLDSMVDISDVISNSPIYSKKMLHFIVEHFNVNLIEGVLRQRLLVNIARDVIMDNLTPSMTLTRHGDDLFYNKSKLSVSIATKSMTSVLIHLGINIDSNGAPVEACGLTSDLKLENIKEIANNILNNYKRENEEIIIASCKVKGVI